MYTCSGSGIKQPNNDEFSINDLKQNYVFNDRNFDRIFQLKGEIISKNK